MVNSCSTMHKITAKEFTLDDFSCEHLITPDNTKEYDPEWNGEYYDTPIVCMGYIIDMLNIYRNKYIQYKTKPMKNESARKELLKKYWWQIIQLLPSSYNQKRTVMLNYEVLANMYNGRVKAPHKLDEWRIYFAKWIERLPYSELITGESDE